MGGGIRVPSVQAKLQQVVGEERIAKHVNADEAAVFGTAIKKLYFHVCVGAGFYGAMITPSFRTLEIRVKDVFPYPITASYLSEPKADQERKQTFSILG